MSNEDALVMADMLSKAPKTIEVVVTKWSTRLDDGCPSCVTKHLAQAIELLGNSDSAGWCTGAVLMNRAAILLREARHGYPGHRYHAIGCLAEAELYFVADAEEIRRIRIAVAKDLGVSDLVTYCGAFSLSDVDLFGDKADKAWAHVSEALRELPSSDQENRGALKDLLSGNAEPADVIMRLTKVLKNVVDTYCLPGGEL